MQAVNQQTNKKLIKVQNKLKHLTGKAIADFNMIEAGDKV